MSGDGETTEYGQRSYEAPAGATEILLVRHGQSAPFREGEPFPEHEGQGDPALSSLGEWQAEQVAQRLVEAGIDAIYVTNLRRTHMTAAPLAARLGLTPAVEADLREVHLGEWEGGVFRVMAAQGHPLIAEMTVRQDWGVIPGGEASEVLRARVRAGIERIHARHPGERVVVVSHGGAIGAVLAEASGARTFAFASADNASISHLVVLGESWTVRRFNDTGHLAGELSARADAPT